MNEVQLNEFRIARLEAAVERISNGNKTDFGRRLGYKDGAFIRQMATGSRPVSEKTVRAIEAMPGMKDWFDPKRGHGAAPSAAPQPWPFPSISEKDVRTLPPEKLSNLEGAIALVIAQLRLGISVAPPMARLLSAGGAQTNTDHHIAEPFPPRYEAADGTSKGGKLTTPMEREKLVQFGIELSAAANVAPGEPPAANEQFEPVPALADVRLAAGHGIEVDSERVTGAIQFRQSFLRSVGADKGRGRVVYAKGDSMDPIIQDGWALLVVPDDNLTIRDLVPNTIYAINYDGRMIVKVIAKDSLSGQWVARSVNRNYRDVPLEHSDISIRVLGRVVWAGGRLQEGGTTSEA